MTVTWGPCVITFPPPSPLSPVSLANIGADLQVAIAGTSQAGSASAGCAPFFPATISFVYTGSLKVLAVNT